MNRLQSRLILCTVAFCLTTATAVQAQYFHTADAGGGLYVQQMMGRALLREPSGEVTELAIPTGTLLRRIQPLAEGWLLSGEVDLEEGRELFLLRGGLGEEPKRFPVPENSAGDPMRINPVPLVREGQLIGIGWIAGARIREGAVYASLWSGTDWSQPEQVSGIGPGTQIGLSGVVLADGSWLLSWSAYDGDDDEIFWSRRVTDRWSPPRPLHARNEEPDVKPELIATGVGALAAWGASDGTTYRVKLAAFDGRRWRTLPFDTPAGTVNPTFTPHGTGVRLLYRRVVESSWVLFELDERGAPLRRLVLDTESTFAPAVVPDESGVLGFEWPGADLQTPDRMDIEWQDVP